MTLGKITIDICVKYFLKGEKTTEIKQKTKEKTSTPRKQNKSFSQSKTKLIKNIAATGLAILKWMMNC